MANIDKELKAIMDAVYGEEVRGSIHDALKAGNDEINRYGLQESARVAAEQARAQAESARATAENARVGAESSREAAELLRQQGETSRQQATQAAVTAAENAATAANTAADRANAAVDGLPDLCASVMLQVYPVGCVYLSTSEQNPGTLFGGTWIAWGQGRVPIGVSETDADFNGEGKTGGAKTISIANKNLPAHIFTLYNAPEGTHGNYSEVKTNTSMVGYVATQVSTRAGDANVPLNVMPPYVTCYMWKRTA